MEYFTVFHPCLSIGRSNDQYMVLCPSALCMAYCLHGNMFADIIKSPPFTPLSLAASNCSRTKPQLCILGIVGSMRKTLFSESRM